MTLALGIDLGGTKIEIIGLDEHGAVLLRRRRPSPPGSYNATLAAIRDLVAEVEAELGTRGTIGFGTPGAISPATGLLKNSNSTWLNGKPLDRDLAAVLERPIALANDADCLALSEATDGAAAGAATVFAVILGTGVGGGLVVHGRVLAGPNAIAGEWGHNPLPWPDPDELPGPPCYCGLTGCIETWLSGPGLARDHRAGSGAQRDPPAIVAAAAHDPAAEAALRRYERSPGARARLGDQSARSRRRSCWAAACRSLSASTPPCPRSGIATCSRTSCARRSCRRSMATYSGVRGAAWLGRNARTG